MLITQTQKCVEDHTVRIEDGQIYHALDEKLKLANKEIAQVPSKAQAEALACLVSLRKEQVHSHLLERTAEQKTEENNGLTGICAHLISKTEDVTSLSSDPPPSCLTPFEAFTFFLLSLNHNSS